MWTTSGSKDVTTDLRWRYVRGEIDCPATRRQTEFVGCEISSSTNVVSVSPSSATDLTEYPISSRYRCSLCTCFSAPPFSEDVSVKSRTFIFPIAELK